MHEATYRNPFSAEILPALGLGIDQKDPWKAIHVEKGQFGPWWQHLQSGPHTLRHVKPYVKTRLWLPLSAPPHTSPVPTSQSCEISDLEASLEKGPEARERQWLESSRRSHHWDNIPQQRANASGSMLAPSCTARCSIWRGKGYTSLSRVSKSITWCDIWAFRFRFLNQPACFVTPRNQIVQWEHLNHVCIFLASDTRDIKLVSAYFSRQVFHFIFQLAALLSLWYCPRSPVQDDLPI